LLCVCSDQGRIARFGAYPFLLHVMARLYATTIRYTIDAGRVYGHICKHGVCNMLMHMGTRFDLYCGLVPIAVVHDRVWAAARCACYLAAIVLVVVVVAWQH
jgi:hypothetical protein